MNGAFPPASNEHLSNRETLSSALLQVDYQMLHFFIVEADNA